MTGPMGHRVGCGAGGAAGQEAGLRPQGMIGVQPHFGPGDPVGVATAVENLRLAVPLIVSTGVATAEQIGIETFEQRLRDEQQRSQAVAVTPILLSAWATCSGPDRETTARSE